MIQQKKSFPIGLTIIIILGIIGALLTAYRFIYGLGAISNLSDGRPWGLWKAFNVYAGITMAAGGFTLAATVYVFNLKKFHIVIRPAILVALLGYLIAMLSLVVEIGLPPYFWRVFFNYNIHSPLFEVIWAILIYTIVLVLEFSPAIFERLGWKSPLKAVRAIQIPAVIAGIMISTGHQSSLGSILLDMPGALHPLWYTPYLPILFLVSVLMSGPSTVILVMAITSKVFHYKLETDVLSGLGKGIAIILGLYLVLKVVFLAIAGNLGLIFSAAPQNYLWWGEMIIGGVVPLVMLAMPNIRKSRVGVITAATLVVLGVIFNRFIVTLFGLAVRPGYTYFPTWIEIGIAIGLIAWALLIAWMAFRFLPMVDEHEEAHA